MKIDYTARRIRLHPAVRDVVEKKMARIEKVLPAGAEARVVVYSEKKGTTVEVAVTARNRTWTAEATAADQQAAAQAAMERIAAQAKKTKAKVKETKKHTVSAVRSPNAWNETDPGERPERRIPGPRREAIVARPMFEEDALNAFAGGGREILVYRDLTDAEAFRVLYRRHDGGMGLLIPS
jgi:putative sigma-54 modulation protein